MGPEPPLQHSLMEDESSVIHELTQVMKIAVLLIVDHYIGLAIYDVNSSYTIQSI